MSVERIGKLIVRADASPQTGLGHVIRCTALAEGWIRGGGEVVFVGSMPDSVADRLRTRGVRILSDTSTPPRAGGQLPSTDAIRAELGSDRGASGTWVVLDGYHFDSAYQAAVSTLGCPCLVIDDAAHLSAYHANILLNQNLGSESLPYHLSSTAETLLGPGYALIRSEFLARRSHDRPSVDVARHILITMGGGDSRNVTGSVLRALSQVDDEGLRATVVCGPSNPNLSALSAQVAACSSNVAIVTDPPSMAELMATADVAVTAGGSTCWEAALMGLPSLVVVTAENQTGVASGLAEIGAAANLGPAETLGDTLIATALNDLCHDAGRRASMRRRGRMLVDGHGSDRVVSAMLRRNENLDGLTLRLAVPEDALPLWSLANDRTVRDNAFNSSPIPLASHLAWFERRLQSSECCMWMLLAGADLVGQIRYDVAAPGVVEISFSVARAYRGMGVGTRLLDRTARVSCERLGATTVRGAVMRSNPGSRRAFEKACFSLARETVIAGFDCWVFERTYAA